MGTKRIHHQQTAFFLCVWEEDLFYPPKHQCLIHLGFLLDTYNLAFGHVKVERTLPFEDYHGLLDVKAAETARTIVRWRFSFPVVYKGIVLFPLTSLVFPGRRLKYIGVSSMLMMSYKWNYSFSLNLWEDAVLPTYLHLEWGPGLSGNGLPNSCWQQNFRINRYAGQVTNIIHADGKLLVTLL